jgi:hypothetical protein
MSNRNISTSQQSIVDFVTTPYDQYDSDDSDEDIPYLVVSADPDASTRFLLVGGVARNNRLIYKHLYVKSIILGENWLPTFIFLSFFENETELERYKTDANKMEDNTKSFFNKTELGVLPISGLYFVLDHIWVPLVCIFIDNWGVNMVPNDIRWAYTDLQRHLEVPLYIWPLD